MPIQTVQLIKDSSELLQGYFIGMTHICGEFELNKTFCWKL